ncbi:MAG: glycosyltransferase, partial [Candidatus Micrarchaeaceae archaeon]
KLHNSKSRAKQGLSYSSSFYNLKIQDDYDVLNPHIAPSHWVSNRNDRVLWYCHTPLREIYDLYSYRMSLRKARQRPVYAIGARIMRAMDRKLVKKIDRIVANSENTAGRILKYYNRKADAVLGGGVDYQNYSNSGYGRYFFYPSRISPNKRQDYAIRAFGIFKKSVKGYRLIIAGQVSKDKMYVDYYKKIVEQAKQVGDIEIITNAGDKRLIELYAGARAVLYTPIDEDYGLVPLEAMASSKPIIAVDEGGPRYTVIDGKTGFLVSNEKDMATKMALVADDKGLAEELGRSGRKRVIAEYSWEKFFEKFDEQAKAVANQ